MANEEYRAILRSLEENNQLCHSIEAKLDILISRSSGERSQGDIGEPEGQIDSHVRETPSIWHCASGNLSLHLLSLFIESPPGFSRTKTVHFEIVWIHVMCTIEWIFYYSIIHPYISLSQAWYIVAARIYRNLCIHSSFILPLFLHFYCTI